MKSFLYIARGKGKYVLPISAEGNRALEAILSTRIEEGKGNKPWTYYN